MTTRLEKFRGYMARLNPAGDPLGAIRDGLYVPRPGRSTADEVAARLELDPTSSHLIIGGIGSGKTTQLLVARDRLNKLSDTRAVYIDVNLVHDLSHMAPGTLIVVAGLAVSQLLKGEDDAQAIAAGEQFRSVKDKTVLLSQLRDGLRASFPHLVLLIDSLDRLSDPAAFATVEAYMRGADHIEEEHLDAVADAFGRRLVFGLKPVEIEVLQRVLRTGTFVPTSDEDMALLMTRHVLEYRNGGARFAVHPTLEPLLAQMSASQGATLSPTSVDLLARAAPNLASWIGSPLWILEGSSGDATEEDDEEAQAEFDRLYRAWIDAVGFSSSLTRKVSHPAYQGIIAMGKRAIPPILRDLEKEPKLWGPALHAITGAQPVPQRDEGKIARVAAAWLRWAKENGYNW